MQPVENNDFFEEIANLSSAQELSLFFEDLCTPQEIASMQQRWLVAKLINQGLTTRTINQQIGASTTTITRVARCVHYGKGYKLLLNRLFHRHQNPPE